ncbi:depupylase/deamidase Dop [Flaviflexus equikiangi]|uniref:Proteasome accessory factor PafA2 n=1 Tax=Flaviflexus equikiangi TaxID=2758573 RepID=A0ABS2TG47_9ACTO|nr:depupylase/deamidase Dop [Flaviflexus equikiangi]MBM9433338.1 proteasome accessory factor PafA2 [Flaviflexus equikiangi]
MSVKRVIGTETEFGILSATQSNPIHLSAALVDAYASAGAGSPSGPIRWDYRGEDPLNDARGFRLERASADPSQLTDNPEAMAPSGPVAVRRPSEVEMSMPRASNTVLSNGARFYVDHAHPEYSGPETLGPLDAVLYDRAGEHIARDAMEIAGRAGTEYIVYKNNVDGKGATYGSHENYLVDRSVDFDDLVGALIPFFVTRPVLCGAGRVGRGQRSEEPGFQISQRADYVENDIGLETTFNRPIINTRDEPHAGTRWRRLHVIGGDANLFDISNFLKFGTTAAVLWVLENSGVGLELDSLAIADPVWETQEVSYDLSLTHRIALRDGSSATALDIQVSYARLCRDAMTAAGPLDDETRLLLDTWDEVIEMLRTDMFAAARKVEWVAKYQMLEAMRARGSMTWRDPKLAAFDLQWHDLRAGRSIVDRLDRAGRIDRLFSPSEVVQAATVPPENTRAFVRGSLITAFPGQVYAAAWDSVTVDAGGESLLRIPTLNPLAGTRDLVGDALEAPDISTFLHRLRG